MKFALPTFSLSLVTVQSDSAAGPSVETAPERSGHFSVMRTAVDLFGKADAASVADLFMRTRSWRHNEQHFPTMQGMLRTANVPLE